MAIYGPTSGLERRTLELWVLKRWVYHSCVRSTQLRGWEGSRKRRKKNRKSSSSGSRSRKRRGRREKKKRGWRGRRQTKKKKLVIGY